MAGEARTALAGTLTIRGPAWVGAGAASLSG